MGKFWKSVDDWLFSPPFRFGLVLKTTDLLLQAADREYAEHRKLALPSALPVAKEQAGDSPGAPAQQPPKVVFQEKLL
jgi:hypothetical protein